MAAVDKAKSPPSSRSIVEAHLEDEFSPTAEQSQNSSLGSQTPGKRPSSFPTLEGSHSFSLLTGPAREANRSWGAEAERPLA